MPRRKLERPSIPTDEEINVAVGKEREVVAFSATNRGQLLFLKLAFRTSDIATIFLDPVSADRLFRLLKKFLPNAGENDASPTKWAADGLEDS